MKKPILLFCLLLLLGLSACRNLPGRESSNQVDGGEDSSEELMIINEHADQSSEPVSFSSEMTVTPIILPIEKRGTTQAVYLGEADDSFEDEFFEESKQGEAETSAVPSNAMRDEMKVVSFSPYSGTTVLPGEPFHLDVMLSNTGTTVWQTSYKIINYSNISYGVTNTINLPAPVGPNDTTVISIYLTAPSNLGSYNQNFMIQDAYGVKFGYFDYEFTVGDHSLVTAIPTLTATEAGAYWSNEGYTATPDSLVWMCQDPKRSTKTDCKQFCELYVDKYPECYVNGEIYIPERLR